MIYVSQNADTPDPSRVPPPRDIRRLLIFFAAVVGLVTFTAGQLLELPADPSRSVLIMLSALSCSAILTLVLDIRSDRRAAEVRAMIRQLDNRLSGVENLLERAGYWRVYSDVLQDLSGIEPGSGSGIEPSSGPPSARR